MRDMRQGAACRDARSLVRGLQAGEVLGVRRGRGFARRCPRRSSDRRVGGLFSPRREILKINGRDQTKLIDGIEKQLRYVEGVLHTAGHTGVELRGALCMADVEGLPLLGSLRIRGILVDGPRRTAALSRRPGTLAPETIDAIWRRLAAEFPSA